MKTLLWTWDYRMRWAPVTRDTERAQAGAPYAWGQDTFLEDYRRLVEAASAANIGGVVVWGFLRDSHGGQSAAIRAIENAKANGVRLMPGVGLCAYGGVYWEGEHPYNLELWLRDHPELAAVDAQGAPMVRGIKGRRNSLACPSQEENVEWTLEGLRWLCETFEPDGIELQTSDEGVCQCASCQRLGGRGGPFPFGDIERLLPAAVRQIRLHDPDAWICCSTSTPLTRARLAGPPFREPLPDDVMIAWFIDAFPGRAAEQHDWSLVAEHRPGDRSPTGRDIGMLPYNSLAAFDEGVVHVERLHRAVALAREMGFQGVMTFGELGGLSHRINYAALASFAGSPELDPLSFLGDLGRWLPGRRLPPPSRPAGA
jgi:hypothetical protein